MFAARTIVREVLRKSTVDIAESETTIDICKRSLRGVMSGKITSNCT